MKFEFYFDAAGVPRARMDDAFSRAGDYLESDIQGSAMRGRQVLAAIGEFRGGARSRFEETGNAHTLTLTRGKALITPEHGNAAPLSMELDEFERLLGAWVDFLIAR